MKLREEEFYEQYHQHGGTTIIPTEIFNELYDDATEEIERLNKALDTAIEIINNKEKEIVLLNNIRNEVREYIKDIQNTMWHDDKEVLKTILEILDKVGE